MRLLCSSSGQSTLETVAVLPLMITVALAIGHVLAAGLAHELAGHAAQAGAIAVIRGGDAKASAQAALPEWAAERVEVRVLDRRVRVRLEPPAVIPGAARLLATTTTADAGPTPSATADVVTRALVAPRRFRRVTLDAPFPTGRETPKPRRSRRTMPDPPRGTDRAPSRTRRAALDLSREAGRGGS